LTSLTKNRVVKAPTRRPPSKGKNATMRTGTQRYSKEIILEIQWFGCSATAKPSNPNIIYHPLLYFALTLL
jgi:hypothetical protein